MKKQIVIRVEDEEHSKFKAACALMESDMTDVLRTYVVHIIRGGDPVALLIRRLDNYQRMQNEGEGET